MNNKLFILFFLLVNSVSFGQIQYDTSFYFTTNPRYYEQYKELKINHRLEHSNGKCYWIGAKDVIGGEAWIFGLDSMQNIFAENFISGSTGSNQVFADFVEGGDGYIYAVGAHYNAILNHVNLPSGSTAYVTKYDPTDLRPVFFLSESGLGLPERGSSSNKIINARDGNLLVAIQMDTLAKVIRIDTSGNVISSFDVDISNSGREYTYNLFERPNGNIVVLGIRTPNSGTHNYTFINEYTSSGLIVGSSLIPGNPYVMNYLSSHMYENGEVGLFVSTSAGYKRINWDSTLTVTGNYTFTTANQTIKAGKFDDHGNLYFCGYYTNNDNGLLRKVKKDGTDAVLFNFSGGNLERFSALDVSEPEEQIVVAGLTASGNFSPYEGQCILLFDSLGTQLWSQYDTALVYAPNHSSNVWFTRNQQIQEIIPESYLLWKYWLKKRDLISGDLQIQVTKQEIRTAENLPLTLLPGDSSTFYLCEASDTKAPYNSYHKAIYKISDQGLLLDEFHPTTNASDGLFILDDQNKIVTCSQIPWGNGTSGNLMFCADTTTYWTQFLPGGVPVITRGFGGNINAISNYGGDTRLIRTNSVDGMVLTTTIHSTVGSVTGTYMTKKTDGFIVAGQGMFQNNLSTDPFIAKTDSSGNLLWVTYTPPVNYRNILRNQIVDLPGESIYGLCQTQISGSAIDYGFSVYNINENTGDLIWERPILLPDTCQYTYSNYLNDSLMVFAGFASSSITGRFIIVLGIDTAANLVWRRQIPIGNSAVLYFIDFKVDKFGNSYVLYQKHNPGTLMDIVVYSFDQYGNDAFPPYMLDSGDGLNDFGGEIVIQGSTMYIAGTAIKRTGGQSISKAVVHRLCIPHQIDFLSTTDSIIPGGTGYSLVCNVPGELSDYQVSFSGGLTGSVSGDSIYFNLNCNYNNPQILVSPAVGCSSLSNQISFPVIQEEIQFASVDTICSAETFYVLPPALPSGGTYSGVNISADTLYPSGMLGQYDYDYSTLNSMGCPLTGTSHVFLSPCVLVWPGDANSDLVVDQLDVYALGLSFGLTGTPRDSISNEFVGQKSDFWNDTIISFVNAAHQDCNGSGMVDWEDTIAIINNFSSFHNFDGINTQRSGVEFSYVFDQPQYAPGDTATMFCYLNGNSILYPDLYGFSFQLTASDPNFSFPITEYQFADSWLGTPGLDLVSVMQNDPNNLTSAFTLVRNDQTGRVGSGFIFSGKWIISSTIGHDEDYIPLLSNISCLDYTGEYVSVSSVLKDTIRVRISNDIEEINSIELNLFPNPAKLELSIRLNTYPVYYQVTDIVGQTISSGYFNSSLNNLDISTLTPGIYSLGIIAPNGVLSQKKFIKQ